MKLSSVHCNVCTLPRRVQALAPVRRLVQKPHRLIIRLQSVAGQAPTLPTLRPLDLLQARTQAGGIEVLQVVQSGDGANFTALWKGKLLRLVRQLERAEDAPAVWCTEVIDCHPRPESQLAKAFPGLSGGVLDDLHNHAGPPPANLSSVTRVHSLAELEEAAKADAAMWCDGTQPGAPERTALQSQTLTAGELVSLMLGKRGVVIVQLWNGFEPSRGQPLYEPWVVHLLEAALATPGIRAVTSVAPGGVGLTAVLFADREPWNAWGPHLASFGCQANVVAGSAYYKVLIGKVLGYKDENIYSYVRSVGGGLTPAVISQVDADLKKLSKAKPKLPWNREGSRGKKGSGGTSGVAGASSDSATRPGGSGRAQQRTGSRK